MRKFIEVISQEMEQAFEAAGYDPSLGRVTVSSRPDLCEYQCNGAMAGAKKYHKAPFMIAEDVAGQLRDSEVFSSVEVVRPGFINLKIREAFLTAYLMQMKDADRFGMPAQEAPSRIILDYGGPNVAKPLHVGHLRSAVIGEAIKRICRYHGESSRTVSRTFPILIPITAETIRRRLPLRSPNWRRSIPMPAKNPKRIRTITPGPWKRPTACRRATGACVPSGTRSFRSP